MVFSTTLPTESVDNITGAAVESSCKFGRFAAAGPGNSRVPSLYHLRHRRIDLPALPAFLSIPVGHRARRGHAPLTYWSGHEQEERTAQT